MIWAKNIFFIVVCSAVAVSLVGGLLPGGSWAPPQTTTPIKQTAGTESTISLVNAAFEKEW
ncbi:MAG: hypothetical protein QF805_09175, partial [Pirellulaceae bacterium]|nr:hypothetical protein [Pirellulaceae bacterium]